MAAVTVHIYDAKIKGLFDRPGELRNYMQAKVNETVVLARVEAPTRTSELVRSIGSTYHGGGHWSISATAPHAKFVHEGTKPHLIRSKTGRALRFYWNKVGRVVTLQQVNHPGTEPNPFLVRAMRKVW